MKPPRPFRSPVALLLLLLGLSLGGWSWWAATSPQHRPRWLAAWLGPAADPDDSTLTDISPAAAGRPDSPPAAPSGPMRAAADLRTYDPKALPKGLTSIEGEGGTGLNRAVKKNGVWFPVYSPGPHPGGGPPPLTAIPLSIATGNPPPGKVDQPFSYQAEAIGGSPPYTWSGDLPAEPGPFLFNPPDATLRGTSAVPRHTPFKLTVTDAAGASDSAALTLTIKPAQDLAIATAALDPRSVGLPFTLSFQATGGVPPYTWDSSPHAPGGLPIDSTGLCSGSPLEAGEYPFTLIVIDAQLTRVRRDFLLTVAESVSIATPSALPPAAPGEPYQGTFAAEGGTPPYTWELDSGRLPDPSWELSPEGVLRGRGGPDSQWAEFSLVVTDAAGATFQKTFHLAVSDLLTLVPSREKVGVAWHPARVSQLLAAGGLTASTFRVLRDGRPVYQGTGSNFVDRGLPTGSTPRYTLVALTSDGAAQALAEQETAVLPQTLERAQPGSTGDPYADRVVSFQPLSTNGYGSANLPRNVTGPPDGRSTYAPAYKPGEVLSLHAKPFAGGRIDLEFTDNIVEIAPGEDLTIFENVLFIGGSANQRFMEPAVVSVALFPGEWRALPCDAVPPAAGQALDLRDPFYYARGFAGRNGTTGEDPTNPARSGGDSLDLDAAAADLSWIRYVRIQSTGDQARCDDIGGDLIRHPDDPAFNPLSGKGSSGFDLDAVSAVHY